MSPISSCGRCRAAEWREQLAGSEPEADAAVDRPVRAEAGAGEDDVARGAEAEEPAAVLEPEPETGPEAAVRGRRLRVDLRGATVGAAVHPGVSRQEELGEQVLGALAEEAAHREPELQAGEAAAGAEL